MYGVLLNFAAERTAWAARMEQPPYLGAPRAPVLYVKTANTYSAAGAGIVLPADVAEVEVGATVAMVMGRGAQVEAWVLLNDLTVPHASCYRPPIRHKCRDGFLGIGARALPASEAGDPAGFGLEVRINGDLRQRVRFDALVRDAAALRADVADFMTLREGDLLMLGCDAGRPLARAGDHVEIAAPGFPVLANTLVAEAA